MRGVSKEFYLHIQANLNKIIATHLQIRTYEKIRFVVGT